MSKISSTSSQEISPTTELIEGSLYMEEPERINAFRDMTFGPNDFLYEDLPWMLGKTPIYKEVQKKNPKFEFRKIYSKIKRVNDNATSRLICSENECEKPEVSPDGNKNEDEEDSITQLEEVLEISEEKIIDPASPNQNNDELIDFCNKGNEIIEREPVHINTAEKVARIEKVLQAQLTAEDYKLMPKYIPEYESVFDGPWILGRMPPYSDSSIPKGPTPPSPIQYQFRQKPSAPSKQITKESKIFRFGSRPLPQLVLESEEADQWVLSP